MPKKTFKRKPEIDNIVEPKAKTVKTDSVEIPKEEAVSKSKQNSKESNVFFFV